MRHHSPAIEVSGLVKQFARRPGWRGLLLRGGERVVLDHVSLAVERGEIFGLLGPNGAGKTTLTKILCTLITPTSGVARVAGFDVVRDEPEVRRRIGLVYGDQRSFFWRLSLVDNLRFYAALYRIPHAAARSRIAELTDLVGLADAADTPMHHFSSGMKQRAAIARGLLSDPEIVLMDEPTTAVDPVAAHVLRQMIHDIVARDGSRTILLCTNLMSEAEQLCHRIALIDNGRIVLVGTVGTLRQRFQPDDRYLLTVSGIGEAAAREACRLSDVGEMTVRPVSESRWELTLVVHRDSSSIPAVVRRLVHAGASVWGCAKLELSLEEMFRLSFGQRTEPTPVPSAAPLPLASEVAR